MGEEGPPTTNLFTRMPKTAAFVNRGHRPPANALIFICSHPLSAVGTVKWERVDWEAEDRWSKLLPGLRVQARHGPLSVENVMQQMLRLTLIFSLCIWGKAKCEN